MNMKLISLIFAVCAAFEISASDGIWTNTVGGNWVDTANWQDGIVAEGADASATFNVALSQNAVVVLPTTNAVIGTVQGGELFTLQKTGSNRFSLKDAVGFSGLWRLGGGTLEIQSPPAATSILQNVEIAAQTTVSISTAGTTTVFSNLVGAAELIKSGSGTLALEKTDGASVITLDQGSLALTSWEPTTPVAGSWFHVDATVPSSLGLELLNGTNFVYIWGDARYQDDHSHSVYSQNYDGTPRPFFQTNVLNGLPVVDFGSFHWIDVGEYGYGGSLVWSVACTTIYEGFLVISDTADRAGAKHSSDMLGNMMAGSGYFNRGEYGTLLNPLWASARLLSAAWTIDGESVAPTAVLKPGFHVISFASSTPVTAEAFARVGGAYFGGQRLAEVLVYTNNLTALERCQNLMYLEQKWFARHAKIIDSLKVKDKTNMSITEGGVAIGTLQIEGTAIKTGESDLIVDSVNGDSLLILEGNVVIKKNSGSLKSLVISNSAPSVAFMDGSITQTIAFIEAEGMLVKIGAGSVEVGILGDGVKSLNVIGGDFTLLNSDDWYFKDYMSPWFHVDATVPSSLGLELLNGTNFVHVWGDARYQDDHSHSVYSQNYDGTPRPFFQTNVLNGLPVVDFGSFRWVGVGEHGYGGSLTWNVACTNIYEGFLVFSDTEDRSGAQYSSDMLGNVTGGPEYFNRGLYGTLLNSTYANANLLSAAWTIDGESVASTAILEPGFHVISFASSSPVTAEAFARVGGAYFGGQRLAEVLVYTNVLQEASRQKICGYLMNKWTCAAARSFETIRVTTGSSVAVSHTLLTTGSLLGEGTLVAMAVAVTNALSAGDADGDIGTLMVNGDLTLTNGVTVTVDFAPPDCDCVNVNGTLNLIGGGTFQVNGSDGELADLKPVVITFSSIEGAANLARWVVIGDVCSRYSVKPVVAGNSVQLKFSQLGLLLLLR